MVIAAGCEVLDIGGQEDASDILIVCFEVGYGQELGLLAVLEEVPDIDTTLFTLSVVFLDVVAEDAY
jgi:hypothetical protein